jgi:hypothetical protein
VQTHPHERRIERQPVGLQRPAIAVQPLAGGETGLAAAEEADAAAACGQQMCAAANAPPALSLSAQSASMWAGGRSTNTTATPASRSGSR